MTKAITAGAAGSDAGDTIGWEVVIENTGTTVAYQIDWTDVLPNGLDSITNAVLATAGGNVYLNDTTTALTTAHLSVSTTTNTDDTLSLPPFQMDAGTTVTVTFDAVLMDTVVPGQVLDNTTRADYTSLPDGGRDNSSDPGNVDDDDDADLDNYEESASQSLTVDSDIAIDKTVAETEYTIGENAVYTITVSLQEGTTPDLEVHDLLPDGLSYEGHDITLGHTGMNIGNGSYETRQGLNQHVWFDFGDLTNPGNADVNDDFIEIEITARVENISTNQDGTVLSNGENADGSEVYLQYGATPTRVDFDSDGGVDGNQGVPSPWWSPTSKSPKRRTRRPRPSGIS